MKNTFILLFLFLSLQIFAQESKRNNNWVVGFWPAVIFNFNNSVQVDTFKYETLTTITATISDTDGNLAFYTTGYSIVTNEGLFVQNGDSINCPFGHRLHDYYGGAGIFDQTSIILPKKGNTYYVFSTGMSDSVADNYLNHTYTEFDVLSYCVVDMDSNQGKGKVVLKDKVLAEKRHYGNTAISAVRHANGKDWWLVKADCDMGRYEEYIVSADTITGPYFQYVTQAGDFCIDIFSQLYFNHQGTQMASSMYGTKFINGQDTIYDFNRVDLYDFDRCDGSITFKNYYMTPYDKTSYPNWDYKNGICFSPNDSLLYMSNNYTLYQIDLTDTGVYNAILIHGPDTSAINYFPEYATMSCAPDGRLYIGNDNGIRKTMSYVDKPNVKGLSCDFKAQGLVQPYTNLMTPPNMPNYGLGKDTTKICWPLQNENEYEEENECVVYPNPTSGKLYIRYHTAWRVAVLKQLFNSVGQLMLQTKEDELDVSHIPKGVYYLHCGNAVRKVVVE